MKPSTWWTETKLAYLMRQGDAEAVIWSKIRKLSSRRPLGLSMVSLDVNHPLPGDFGPLCPQIYLIFPDLSRERIFMRLSLPWMILNVVHTLWTPCFQYQPLEAERGLVRPQNHHFLTQKPYGLPFLLVKFFDRTHRFRVIN